MRTVLAHTLARLVFFTITGVLSERFVAGMAWGGVARYQVGFRGFASSPKMTHHPVASTDRDVANNRPLTLGDRDALREGCGKNRTAAATEHG